MAEDKQQVKREVVSIGIDFRPVPIDMGDSIIWEFDPDPDPEKWNALTQALIAFGSVAGAMKDFDSDNPDAEKVTEATSQLTGLIDGLTGAIADLLVKEPQRKKFTDRGYSMFALQRLAKTLMENLSGFPTK